MNSSQNDFDFDVAIIGGGISGIAAAHTLSGSQKKLNWALFEASQKLGGRIQSISIDGRMIDTGAFQLASFLQNRPQKIELYQLIKKGFCQVNHFPQKYNKIYYYDQTGALFDQKTVSKINEKMDELRALTKEWVQKQQNLSLRESYARYMESKQYGQLNQAQKRLFQLIVVMQEHEQAADGQNLPAEILYDNDELQGDLIDAYPIPSITYNGIVQKIIKELPSDCKINLNNFVTNIKRQSDHCVIQVKQKKGNDEYETKIYKCRYVICAVPLPIIQNKIIVFEPKIPESHSFIFDNLGFGFMEKIILSFQERFWPEDTQRIKVACNKRGKFPHFVNLSGLNENNQETHILVCFITAKFVQQTINNYSDKEIVQLAVQQLRIAYPNSNIKLKDSHVTRWMKQKNINGAFSYAMPNLRFKKAKEIRKPIDNLLWFVGEYCYPQNIGCAHGAFETGHLAAKQIQSLQQLKN